MFELLDNIRLIPPSPARCPVCADRHNPDQPHNKNSLYYQMRFYRKEGHMPTWADAMSHCSDSIQTAWLHKLQEIGADVG